MKDYYTISELASEFGVTPRTLRHYENEGLLAPRRKGNTRLFSGQDRGRLKLALRGKRLGLSIGEIRELFKLYQTGSSGKTSIETFLAKLDDYRSRLEQQREDIEIMLNEIAFFERQCRKQIGP
ncbi:MAG TPA: MerR family DNA-binding transcriptional regulator [Burkholderiales bacterium]|nr:MerR family DNA-binding transcriptional regulator [Burkholderiales bacterium]